MPLTPIHCSIAYLARALKPTLSLPALLVSTMAPDLEIPLVYLATCGQYSRLYLHSLVGSVTLATVLSVALTVGAYAPVVSRVFRVDYATVKKRCRFSWGLVGACMIGSFSHVLIDAFHHEYNPLFFPFTSDSYDALVFMKDWVSASGIVTLVCLSVLVFLVVVKVRSRTENIWFDLLVE